MHSKLSFLFLFTLSHTHFLNPQTSYRLADDSRWTKLEQSKTGILSEYTVSYHILMPSTAYTFRVIAYNRYGISFPVYSKDSILTPSKLNLEYGYLQHKPFYRQTWFMVSLAATSIVIIVMVIAVLCVKSKSYKYKRKWRSKLGVETCMRWSCTATQSLRWLRCLQCTACRSHARKEQTDVIIILFLSLSTSHRGGTEDSRGIDGHVD